MKVESTQTRPPLPAGRKRLAQLARIVGDVISIEATARALNMDRADASKALARLTHQGWLRRVESV